MTVKTTTVQVPAGPGDLILLHAALAATTQANAEAMVEDESLPCCSDCAELQLTAPSEREHEARAVRIRGVREVVESGAGTCAELAAVDAGGQNARFLRGESDAAAECVILEDARGPGRHHVITQKTNGQTRDHSQASNGGCGC